MALAGVSRPRRGESAPHGAALRSALPAVCIVARLPISPSEPFIRDHVERLPARTAFLQGWMPLVGGKPALSRPRRLVHRALSLLGEHRDHVVSAAYAAAFRKTGAIAVLAEYAQAGILVLDACRIADVPLVVHFHGYDASVKDLLRREADAYRRLFAQAAAIVVVSRAMGQKLQGLGAPPEKLHYSPCGVDCTQFRGASPAAAPPTFVAVGRLTEKKGPTHTLRAFAAVRREHPEARLRIVGDGPLRAECEALVEELGLGGSVTFLGVQPRRVIQEEMRAGRCFVQHSIEAASGDTEGTPVAVLEAGATGLPVVSTRHGGIPEVVIEGRTGLLVDEGDWPGMAQAMSTLAGDPQLAAQLGSAARQHVQEHFSIDRSIARLWQIVESCAKRAQS
jgi:glycosyltransferase involved in cell wall biosynthesis